jgi:hypothetical protein
VTLAVEGEVADEVVAWLERFVEGELARCADTATARRFDED